MFGTGIDLKRLEKEYEDFCSLDEITVFSSQDLNTDFVGCIRDALRLHDEVNYIAKFVLQHLNHYVEFCKETNDFDSMSEARDLISDIITEHGDKLEADVQEIYYELVDYFNTISRGELPSRTVSFGCFYEMYGTVVVEIPGDVKDEDVLEYIQNNWDDMPLPRDGNYVNDSSGLDVGSVVIHNSTTTLSDLIAQAEEERNKQDHGTRSERKISVIEAC